MDNEPLKEWEEDLLNVPNPESGKEYIFINAATRARFKGKIGPSSVGPPYPLIDVIIEGTTRNNALNRNEWTINEVPPPPSMPLWDKVKALRPRTVFRITGTWGDGNINIRTFGGVICMTKDGRFYVRYDLVDWYGKEALGDIEIILDPNE